MKFDHLFLAGMQSLSLCKDLVAKWKLAELLPGHETTYIMQLQTGTTLKGCVYSIFQNRYTLFFTKKVAGFKMLQETDKCVTFVGVYGVAHHRDLSQLLLLSVRQHRKITKWHDY